VTRTFEDDKQLIYDDPSMKKSFYPLYLASLVAVLTAVSAPANADPYKFPHVSLPDLPSALQEAYRNERPHLGEIGRCAVSFDSSMDQEKMVFTCSIYVKMSAVAERKAMERCDQMKTARSIKAPCKVISE
jgi:hypothetical protein